MPDSKLVMFGKPAVGAAVMLAAPLAALDIPLKVLVWEDRNGAVSAIMHRCALLPWMTKTGSRTVSAGTGSGADWGFLRRPAGPKVHSGGGGPPVVTVRTWTVRGRVSE